jgi:hypothetical protein
VPLANNNNTAIRGRDHAHTVLLGTLINFACIFSTVVRVGAAAKKQLQPASPMKATTLFLGCDHKID